MWAPLYFSQQIPEGMCCARSQGGRILFFIYTRTGIGGFAFLLLRTHGLVRRRGFRSARGCPHFRATLGRRPFLESSARAPQPCRSSSTLGQPRRCTCSRAGRQHCHPPSWSCLCCWPFAGSEPPLLASLRPQGLPWAAATHAGAISNTKAASIFAFCYL